MRLLFIAPFGTCRKQTVQRRMLPLARGLAEAGHALEVLIPAWDCPQQAGRVARDGGVTVRYPRLGPAPHRLLDPALVRRMLAAADAFRPDIVHAFKPIGYSGVLAILLQRRGYPVVVDIDDLETRAGWGQRRRSGLRQLVEWQERLVLRRANGVSVASRFLQAHVASIRQADSSLYLPNGLDLASEPAPVASNPPIVLLYTRGNDVSATRVAKLWSDIMQRVPEAKLHIVGDWPEAPDLPRCERLGWLEGGALTAALRSAAVAWFSIVDSPLVQAKSPGRLLDCLAHGLPIVTEAVGEYGLLVGPGAALSAGDDEGLVNATIKLLEDRTLRQERSELSWGQAKNHTWERRAEKLLAWYEQFANPFG